MLKQESPLFAAGSAKGFILRANPDSFIYSTCIYWAPTTPRHHSRPRSGITLQTKRTYLLTAWSVPSSGLEGGLRQAAWDWRGFWGWWGSVGRRLWLLSDDSCQERYQGSLFATTVLTHGCRPRVVTNSPFPWGAFWLWGWGRGRGAVFLPSLAQENHRKCAEPGRSKNLPVNSNPWNQSLNLDFF